MTTCWPWILTRFHKTHEDKDNKNHIRLDRCVTVHLYLSTQKKSMAEFVELCGGIHGKILPEICCLTLRMCNGLLLESQIFNFLFPINWSWFLCNKKEPEFSLGGRFDTVILALDIGKKSWQIFVEWKLLAKQRYLDREIDRWSYIDKSYLYRS